MKTYWQIYVTTIKEYFAYRLNFVLWRVRTFMNLLIIFFLWYSALEGRSQFGTINKPTLFSYILIANFLITVVMGTRTPQIASDINDGNIINNLLKPVAFFQYHFVKDLADKTLNLVFAFIEMSVVIYFFKIPLVPLNNWALFTLLIINGLLIAYFINLLLSFVGFWTTEVWAPRFLFFMIVSFLSGSYFPLNLLPQTVYNLLLLSPFPYLYYLPTQVLIINVDANIVILIFMSYLWVGLSYLITRYVWIKGNKSFSFWGK